MGRWCMLSCAQYTDPRLIGWCSQSRSYALMEAAMVASIVASIMVVTIAIKCMPYGPSMHQGTCLR